MTHKVCKTRSYNVISEEKIGKMMEVTYQQRTEAKIRWAVKLYNDWRSMRIDQIGCDLRIGEADLNDFTTLNKENFEFALCRFICEVKKIKDAGDFPGRTLYQIVCCIQNFLRKNDVNWRLVHGDDFRTFQTVLDNVMKERASQNIGLVKKQAQFISMRFEDGLWERRVLGEDTPDKLRSTVLFLIGVNCALRAGDEHYALRRPGDCLTSQFSFEQNSMGIRCLVYREDSVTKTNKGGLKDMKKEQKIIWVKPNVNVNRCPVRLIEKYMNLLPMVGKKPNFYLQSLTKTRPNCWYSATPVGVNTLRKCVGELLRNAGLDGYFTNHSLRRTCATRLFQAGADVKLVKEITGHISDAVHKYQETSDEQRMGLSDVIQGVANQVKLSQSPGMEVVTPPKEVSDEEKFRLPKLELAGKVEYESKSEKIVEGTSANVSEIIENTIKAIGNRRAKLTIHIELHD